MKENRDLKGVKEVLCHPISATPWGRGWYLQVNRASEVLSEIGSGPLTGYFLSFRNPWGILLHEVEQKSGEEVAHTPAIWG